MKDADEAIGKVMAGLRGVEVGPGLAGRVVAGVEGRMTGRRSVGLFSEWRWVGGVCVALVLVGAGLTVRQVERRRVVTTHAVAVRGAGGVAGPGSVGEIGEGESRQPKPLAVVPFRGVAEAAPLRRAGFSQGTGPLGIDPASAGSAESGDRSFPAPPLPLTEQERLLLRVARRGEALPVATFDIAALPSADAAEAAEFQGFFGNPEPIEQINQGESK